MPAYGVPSTPIRHDDHGYLQGSRAAVLRCVELYQLACAHSDAALAELGTAAPATVEWWPEDVRATTSGALLARVLKDTAMHAGQLQIVRELIDGRAGMDRSDGGDDAWWDTYTRSLDELAQRFRG